MSEYQKEIQLFSCIFYELFRRLDSHLKRRVPVQLEVVHEQLMRSAQMYFSGVEGRALILPCVHNHLPIEPSSNAVVRRHFDDVLARFNLESAFGDIAKEVAWDSLLILSVPGVI